MDLNDIYKVFNEEFMGHKVDTVIIAKPYEVTDFDIFLGEYAKLQLEKEAKLGLNQT